MGAMFSCDVVIVDACVTCDVVGVDASMCMTVCVVGVLRVFVLVIGGAVVCGTEVSVGGPVAGWAVVFGVCIGGFMVDGTCVVVNGIVFELSVCVVNVFVCVVFVSES